MKVGFVTDAAMAFLSVGPGEPVAGDLFGGVAGASFVLLSLAFATVGAIIVVRVPGNAVGPLFLATALTVGVGMVTYQYADYAVHAPASLPAGSRIAVWIQNFSTPPIAGLLALSLLCFPDGRAPSPRWRLVAVVSLLGIG